MLSNLLLGLLEMLWQVHRSHLGSAHCLKLCWCQLIHPICHSHRHSTVLLLQHCLTSSLISLVLNQLLLLHYLLLQGWIGSDCQWFISASVSCYLGHLVLISGSLDQGALTRHLLLLIHLLLLLRVRVEVRQCMRTWST